ncbi:hypothetical protein GGI21_000514 [Coemansia aciculifera]|nr:hypothetical protein GGI21_000514 [Coemansia aciculifera]
MLSGFVHLWLYDVATVPPPKEAICESAGTHSNTASHAHHGHDHEAPAATTWFQGHILTGSTAEKVQFILTGVPAANPPHIHGCMVSEHDTPTFYDIFISEYCADKPVVKYCAINVERSGGSGDAVELQMEDGRQEPAAQYPAALMVKQLKLSTTRMVTGERARCHLDKYAPGALSAYEDAGAIVVCMGMISLK